MVLIKGNKTITLVNKTTDNIIFETIFVKHLYSPFLTEQLPFNILLLIYQIIS